MIVKLSPHSWFPAPPCKLGTCRGRRGAEIIKMIIMMTIMMINTIIKIMISMMLKYNARVGGELRWSSQTHNHDHHTDPSQYHHDCQHDHEELWLVPHDPLVPLYMQDTTIMMMTVSMIFMIVNMIMMKSSDLFHTASWSLKPPSHRHSPAAVQLHVWVWCSAWGSWGSWGWGWLWW